MKKLLFLVFCASILTACSNKNDDFKHDNSITKCLLSKNYKYEDLLTKADVAKHVNIDEGSYKIDISQIKGEYGSCTYQWASDRPNLEMELLGQTIKYPDVNLVTIKQLTFYTDDELKLYNQPSALALFDQGYKKLSQEEYKLLLANLEKEYANDATRYETAKGFLDQRMKFTYEPIDNLGDRAYAKWGEYGLELVVLSGMAHFTIACKIDAAKDVNTQKAINFAREVLAKCGN